MLKAKQKRSEATEPPWQTNARGEDANGDENRAIRDLTERLSEAWNANDGRRYAALFTEDCDYIAFDGTRLKGRDENARHHDALFQTVLRGSRLQYTTTDVRFLAPDVALMHADGSVLMSWQRHLPESRRSIQTYVVVRREGTWRIAAFQNARVRPIRVPRGILLRLLLALFHLRTAVAGSPYDPNSEKG